MPETIVIAIGGNSLIADPKNVTVPAQYEAARQTAAHIVQLAEQGHKIAIVHGNGPQVGFILRRGEIAKKELHTVPLDSCVADTQGALGYNIQMALRNEMLKVGLRRPSATVVTQVVVNKADPSFQNPSKPIGSFMEEADARLHEKQDGWDVVEDAGRGYRRVVPSPKPEVIIELETVKSLLENNTIVIAAGGGGIPVIQNEDGSIQGIEAVIDKDFAAGLLAKGIRADRFIISTAVVQVCINFGKPDQKALAEMTVAEAERYMKEGHFAPGSMLPKIQAMISFIRETGNPGLITDPAHLDLALKGKTGTKIIP
jgi:carbamate kinase